jgi:hypothetical protein
MSKTMVQTHAGDDSDGRIWGFEGMNILFILAGLLLSVGLSLLLVRHHPPMFSVAVGALPFVLATAYVFALRQGKPKCYDRPAGNPNLRDRMDGSRATEKSAP